MASSIKSCAKSLFELPSLSMKSDVSNKAIIENLDKASLVYEEHEQLWRFPLALCLIDLLAKTVKDSSRAVKINDQKYSGFIMSIGSFKNLNYRSTSNLLSESGKCTVSFGRKLTFNFFVESNLVERLDQEMKSKGTESVQRNTVDDGVLYSRSVKKNESNKHLCYRAVHFELDDKIKSNLLKFIRQLRTTEWYKNNVVIRSWLNPNLISALNSINMPSVNNPGDAYYDQPMIPAKVFRRKFQSKLRDDLLKSADHRCMLTGASVTSMLVASHIRPVKECIIIKNELEASGKITEMTSEQIIEKTGEKSLNNVLLLSSFYDNLFDRYLITINEKGYVEYSKALDRKLGKYVRIKRLKLSSKHMYGRELFLNEHRAKFKNIQKCFLNELLSKF